jgi:signal transduction histidine kinase
MTRPEQGDSGGHFLPAALLHDLRNPLNQIIGYTELLLEEVEAAGQEGFLPHLHKVRDAGYQMLALLEANFHTRPDER